jgi:hypothetical protein
MTPESELAVYSALSRHVMPSLLILSEIFLFLTFLLHVLVPEFRKPIFGEFPEFRKPIFGECAEFRKPIFGELCKEFK